MICRRKYNHEEADTSIIRHACMASTTRNDLITVYSPDTDVFVFLIAFSTSIPANICMLGAKEKVYDISSLSAELGGKRSAGLLGLHAFSGCDTSGKFKGKGKGSWLKLFLGASDEILERFCNLGEHDPRHYMHVMEAFVCKAYCPKATKLKRLEGARYHIFKTKLGDPGKLPPTSGTLLQHVLRAHYQCYIWRQALIPMQSLLDPLQFGWEMSNLEYMPICTLEAIALDEILMNTTCTCEGQCKDNRCGCVKRKMECSGCGCSEFCENSDRYVPRDCEESDDDNY